jgi:hypothetical protein
MFSNKVDMHPNIFLRGTCLKMGFKIGCHNKKDFLVETMRCSVNHYRSVLVMD